MTVIRDTDYKPTTNVPLKSPLAIGGFLIHFLRGRYSEPFGAPWIWRPNELDTDLFITSGNVIENELRNNRPAIYVTVGQSSLADVVLGDNAETLVRREQKFSYNKINLGVTINCESASRGESHQLGWFTFVSLAAARDVLRAKYRLPNMGNFSMSAPRPAKKDRETFVTSINLALTYELTWNVDKVQTDIKEIFFSLDLQADRDPTQFLTEIYLQSLDKTKQV
jgi:hypothetical protein